MKKKDIFNLYVGGILNITNHTLDVKHAYKVVKFRKSLSDAFEAIGKDEEAIRKDLGIDKPEEFDKELNDLRKIEKPNKEQKAKKEEMEATAKRFWELRAEMLKEDVTLDCKALPYEEWFKLQNENKDKEINGKKVDLLSGYAEDCLFKVLWDEPEE